MDTYLSSSFDPKIRSRSVPGPLKILCAQIREPAQGSETWKEAILATPRDYKSRQSFYTLSDRLLRDVKVAGSIICSCDGIVPGCSSKKVTFVDPFGLNEFELAS